jgi:probable addiction module antidote protein
MSGPVLLTTPSRRTNEEVLKAAFATNDLRRICRAVDEAVLRGGIAKVAQNAKVDRTTIYRAFRRENGPALDTMVKVLHVLGSRLIVEIKPNPSLKRPQPDAKTTARSLTRSFRSGDLDLAVAALAKALHSQENVSEFARTTIVSRENLYRAFAFPRIPRFRTVLDFLNAVGLQFGIERLPSKGKGAALQRSTRPRVAPKDHRTEQPDHRGCGFRKGGSRVGGRRLGPKNGSPKA